MGLAISNHRAGDPAYLHNEFCALRAQFTLKDYGYLSIGPTMRAVLVGYCRTPFHRAHRGALKDTRPEDMTAAVIKLSLIHI